jgi:hypothetical protein
MQVLLAAAANKGGVQRVCMADGHIGQHVTIRLNILE